MKYKPHELRTQKQLIQGFRTPLRFVLHPWLPSAAPIGAGLSDLPRLRAFD